MLRVPRHVTGSTMHTPTSLDRQRQPSHIPTWLGVCALLVIAAFFLYTEHRAHILGALPYALLLLCPIIHVFMHRGHSGHRADPEAHGHHRSTKGAGS